MQYEAEPTHPASEKTKDRQTHTNREVMLGADNGKEIQILSGLKAGDKVVTEGAYQVKLAGATNAIPAHSHEH